MKNPALSLRKAHHPVPVRAGINSAVTIGSVCGEIKRGYLALGGIRPPGAGETQPLTLDMKKELITQLHQRFESCAREKDGVSFWLARELQELLGYTQWRNFEIVVTKAKTACSNAGQRPEDHFAEVSKMIDLGKGAQREVTDIALTRPPFQEGGLKLHGPTWTRASSQKAGAGAWHNGMGAPASGITAPKGKSDASGQRARTGNLTQYTRPGNRHDSTGWRSGKPRIPAIRTIRQEVLERLRRSQKKQEWLFTQDGCRPNLCHLRDLRFNSDPF